MKLSPKQTGHILIFFVVAIFSINIPISKFLLTDHISPFGLTGLRVLFGSIAFWAVSFFVKKETVSKRDHLILMLGGLAGILFNQGLFIVGLSRTSPVDASIIVTSTPLFAMLIAALILKEPITSKKISGVFIGAMGAILLVYTAQHGDNQQDSHWVGNLMVVGSSLSYAFYLVITKPLSTKYSSITIMKWMFTYAGLLCLPFFYKDITTAPLFSETDPKALIALAYPLVVATLFAYMLIPMAQKRIRATTISMYNNLQPVIASTIAIALGMDKFTIEKLVAAILVLVGVYLVTQSKSRADIEKEESKVIVNDDK